MSVEIVTTETVKCKHCDSEAVYRWGTKDGKPYYYCKVCKRRFHTEDKQFRNKTPTEQISTAMHGYYNGESVRAVGRHILQETGKTPSTATIYEWIQKYSQYLTQSVKDYPLKDIGNEWIADETVLKMGGSQVWLWDIIDTRSRVLLASRLSRSRTTQDAQMLIDRAIKASGKHPEKVVTDQLRSYLDVFYGKDAEHIQGSPFEKKETGESTSLIERWHGTLKSRTKVMRGLKNFETANDFTETYCAYYNYLRPHESLDNRTPAQAAGVTYPYRNWDDVIRQYKPKTKIEVTHVERARIQLPKTYVGRHPKPHTSHATNTFIPRAPRLSPKFPRLSNTVDLGAGVVRDRRGQHLRLD